jgi:hypothetical protein
VTDEFPIPTATPGRQPDAFVTIQFWMVTEVPGALHARPE